MAPVGAYAASRNDLGPCRCRHNRSLRKLPPHWDDPTPTALLVLADGTVLEGIGFGATGHAVGEVCFNTAMTGYEEILTDPSYAGQIITFTFPHIGNVGTNEDDIETVNLAATPGARGVVLHSPITAAVELPRHAPSRCLAEEPRHHRALPASTPAR